MAPTSSLSCMFADEALGRLDGTDGSDTGAEIDTLPRGSEGFRGVGGTPLPLRGGPLLATGALPYRVVTPATFLSATSISCAAPPCSNGSAPCFGTLRLRASTAGDTPLAWSADFCHFTLYKASSPPEVNALEPVSIVGLGSYADLSAPHALTLHGANFAPTGGALRCRFGDDGGAQLVATFYHAGLVRCATPAAGNASASAAARVGTVAVRLTTSGGGAELWSVDPAPNMTFYDGSRPATIDSVMPILAIAGEPIVVTLTGSNWAPFPPLNCTHRGHAVQATWLSDAVLTCELPAAPVGSFAPVGVISHGLEGTSAQRVTHYDPNAEPVIRSISPPYGALDAETTHAHTVHGSNFGPTDGLRCRYGFDADGDAPATFLTPFTIACASPPFGAPMDVPVVASHNGGANFSLTAARFTYHNASAPPIISSFAPRYGPANGGTRLAILGHNFAPLPNLRCTIGGISAPATFDSATLVRCRTPAATEGMKGSDDVAISLSMHTIAPGSGTAPDIAPSNNTASNMAPGDGTTLNGTAPNGTALNGTAMSMAPGNDTALNVTMPALTADVQAASVPDDVVALAPLFFTYHEPDAEPHISHVTPDFGPTAGGGIVVVHGHNYAPTAHGQLLCQWGLLAPVHATFHSHTMVSCAAPPHRVGDVHMAVSVLGEERMPHEPSHGGRYTYYTPSHAPAVQSVAPRACDLANVASACVVRVEGGNFAPTPNLTCIFAGGRVYGHLGAPHAMPPSPGMPPPAAPPSPRMPPSSIPPNATSANATSGVGNASIVEGVGAARPPGCVNGTCVLLSAASFASAHSVLCVAPRWPSALPGDYAVHVAHEASDSYNLAWWNPPTVPAAPATPAVAWRGSATDEGGARVTLFYAHLAPTLDAVTPIYAVPDGGTVLTLRGSNFAPTSTLHCRFSATAEGGGGDGLSPPPPPVVVPATMISFEEATCDVPEAVAVGVAAELGEVQVALSHGAAAGGGYSGERTLRYTQLIISRVEPEAGPTYGGTAVTLHGVGMRDVTRCRFGGERRPYEPLLHHAVTPSATSDEIVICPSPGHPRGPVLLAVSYGSIHWSGPLRFTYYEQPVLTGRRPAAGVAGGGTLLRLLGFGMSNWPLAAPNASGFTVGGAAGGTAGADSVLASNTTFCRFGHGADAVLMPLIGRTPSLVRCRTPTFATGPVAVELTFNNHDWAAGLPPVLFTFYPGPEIASVTPRGGPINGGTSVLVQGTQFSPAVLSDASLINVRCRFGVQFQPSYQHIVPATLLDDARVLCHSPTTILEGYAGGYPGAVSVSLALAGGSDGTPDDVDFVEVRNPDGTRC